MPIIADKYHKLKITLVTKLKNKNNIYLSVYKDNNGDDTWVHDYVPTINGDVCTFNIDFKDSWFNDGDVITKILASITGSYNLYELHEGLAIVVDGAETPVKLVEDGDIVIDDNDNEVYTDSVTNPQFALNFADNEAHTVQAVYKGNKEIGVAVSDRLIFQAAQRPVDEDTQVEPLTGKYVLEITKMAASMKYMEQPNWQFKLTKGGVLCNGKTVEVNFPHANGAYNGIASMTTKNGYINITSRSASDLAKWKVGKHKICGRFYHYDEVEDSNTVLTQVCKEITIKKNDPKMSFTAAGSKGKNAKFTLKDPLGQGMANKKVTIKVGSKKYIKTTNKNGNAYLAINNKGKFTYKVTYNGDSNLNKKTFTFEERIS